MEPKLISSKKHLTIFISLFIIPLIMSLFFHNYYSLLKLNSEVAQTGENTINLYQKQLENNLKSISSMVSNYWANDYTHKILQYKTSSLSRYLAGYEVTEKYRNIIRNSTCVGGMFLFSKVNDLKWYNFQENWYTQKIKDETRLYADSLMEEPVVAAQQGWIVQSISGQAFLFRVLGNYGAYTVIMIDLNKTIEDQINNASSSEGFLFYCTKDGVPLSINNAITAEDLRISEFDKKYYLTNKNPRYLVVNNYSDIAHVNLLYFVPYYGYLSLMSKIQIVFLLIFILIVFLIPLIFKLMSRTYFKPMENLISTMEKIRDGNVNEKLKLNYKIKEFQEVNITFNQMMDQINRLKVESYEKQLQRNQAVMQYLQLQIKPHFFLNCLKTMYSMAEQKKYDGMKDMIIQVSSHLRYFFNDTMSRVTLEDEIEYVQNYIDLQKNSMLQDVECEIEVEESVKKCPIPVLLIYPFVENSFKYGRRLGKTLVIHIKVVELKSEEGRFIDIIISDNGNGFKEEILEQVNSGVVFKNTENYIGLSNIKQRMYLLYGDQAVLQCSNTSHGSQCEVIIPVIGKSLEGAADEYIDC